ncbi:MAG: carbamate kinase [Defluviitaleaceae bacterium]|nr:carbamate kinase [Defluviitaleaceae bacterium]
MSKIVIALGGNALGNDAVEQRQKAAIAAAAIVDLVAAGHEVLVGHGNGPQVGMIKNVFDESEKAGIAKPMPFPECTAMSQGYIGFHLQTAIEAELGKRGINKQVAALVSRVLVDEADPAFAKPTKPVGGYYDEAAAKHIMAETGQVFGEDAGRGWRRMVASPMPIDILEKDTVKTLLSAGRIVIAAGGGGIPVANRSGSLTGVDAVVDKDFSAAKLAELIDADVFIILTAVEKVCINYKKDNEETLSTLTVARAKELAAEGHFAPGSMLPKVQAVCMYVETKPGRKAIITSLEKAADALAGTSGTVFE